MRTIRRLLATGLALWIALSAREAHAIAQRVGDFELEIDAPWRMEPHPGPVFTCIRNAPCDRSGYGAIPIQVSIHDADQPDDLLSSTLQQLITIKQSGTPWYIVLWTLVNQVVFSAIGSVVNTIASLFGMEVVPDDFFPPVTTLERFRTLRVYEEVAGQYVLRRTYGIEDFHEVERTEGLWQWAANQPGPESPYSPPPRPAYSLCRRWQGESCAAFDYLRNTSEWHATAFYQPAAWTAGADVQLRIDLLLDDAEDGSPGSRLYSRWLTVHLGDSPLPRFDSRWAYGDLHYHSQGTDNDGESAYSYRGAMQAMGALGLDFAFATDHASNSRQIGSVKPIVTPALVQPLYRGLRDLSPDRFAFNLGLLNGTWGANRQATSFPRATGTGWLVAPQLFLGAEVDVIAEIDPEDFHTSNRFQCQDLPGLLKALDQASIFPSDFWCDSMTTTAQDGRLLLRDVQGPDGLDLLSTRFYGRQHVLHLPVDAQRTDAFIPSNTSKYGGATRRLKEILSVELAQRAKGYVFLAHPFSHPEGAGYDRLGPDEMSYSDGELRDAFASPHVLGLQLWNGDGLRKAEASDLQPFDGSWETQERASRRVANIWRWDRWLLWGLDPGNTASLGWLPAGDPRRILLAGGSDAHGDLNYRRSGYFLGTEGVNETALGMPRNLVFAGDPQGQAITTTAGTARPFSQEQIVAGLRSGTFSVTDGPAVRVAYDVNSNGVIDDADVPMGGIAHPAGCGFSIIVEWKSTPEFAPVEWIDLYLGVFSRRLGVSWVYSPWRGSGYTQSQVGGADPYLDEHSGITYVRTPHLQYWYDPTGTTLAITPGPSEQYAGRRVISIDPRDFPLGYGVCVRDPSKPIDPTPGQGSGGGPRDPDFACDRSLFENATPPDRLFIRAEVRNANVPGSDQACEDAVIIGATPCIHRQAYSNPVWVNLPATPAICGLIDGSPPEPPPLDSGSGSTASDSDQDGLPDELDGCPFYAQTSLADTDGDGRWDECECGDQNGDGRNTVSDVLAINNAIFNPALATPMCDANNDGVCNVGDILAVNLEIFSAGNTSTCARQPVPGPQNRLLDFLYSGVVYTNVRR